MAPRVQYVLPSAAYPVSPPHHNQEGGVGSVSQVTTAEIALTTN